MNLALSVEIGAVYLGRFGRDPELDADLFQTAPDEEQLFDFALSFAEFLPAHERFEVR